MSHVIQHLVMPNLAFGAPEEMYARMQNDKVHALMSEGRLLFDCGGRATFDTFFNSITVGAWKSHTAVQDLQLHLRGSGRFIVRLGMHRVGHAHRWLAEHIVTLSPDTDTTIEVDGWTKLESGMLYFALEALEPGSITEGHFATCTAPQREVKLGIVITHFNRKQWVLPAIARIRNELLSDPRYKGRIELVVVDNSQNITAEEAHGITLIPNKNLGGSGGFTRGLLHLKDRQDFTHCLFMDDDASCEIESIRRAFNLLRNSKQSNLAISGSLLREIEQSKLHEKGGGFSGGWRALKHGLDMRHIPDLLEAENPRERVDYGAWWFFAFDIDHPKNLAYPFFVRGDDAQFGLQNNFDILTLNGIGCWGEDFWLKEGPLTRYLGARATFVLGLVFSNLGILAMLRMMMQWFATSLFSYNYASSRAVRMAISDFSRGPIFFLENMDTARIRQQIAEFSNTEKMQPLRKSQIDFAPPCNRETRLRKVLRALTLNGFIIPHFLFKKRAVWQPKTFRATFKEIFLYEKIFYQYEQLDIGYLTQINRITIISELSQFLICIIRFSIKYRRLRSEYKNAMSDMTSESFWRNVYKD